MGAVIYMESRAIAPKTERGIHMGQRYTLQFDPNAPAGERWVWIVRFTREYEYIGCAASLEAALRAAKKQIKELVDR